MATGLTVEPCVVWTGFDISSVARSYAQLASLLAGFAFVVITLMVDRAYERRAGGNVPNPREIDHETLTGVALVSGFLGLFLAAVQYSLLTGERGCALTDGRAASAEILSSISFVASVYLLLYALVQFVSGSAGKLARHCTFIVAVLVPPIAVFFVEATLADLAVSLGDAAKHQPLQPLWDDVGFFALPIPLALALVSAVLWRSGMTRRRSVEPIGRTGHTIRTVIPYVTVAVVLCVVIRSVTALPTTNLSAHISPGEAWLWVGVFAVMLLAQGTALSFQKGVESLELFASDPADTEPAAPQAE